jgi:hypothetical protein
VGGMSKDNERLDRDPMAFYYEPLRNGMHERVIQKTRAPEPQASRLERLVERMWQWIFD